MWNVPGSTGGSAITGYTVTSTPGARTCSTASTSCVVTGLTNGAIYTFTVTASNAQGTGPASSASPGVTPAAAPSAPTEPVAAIGNAKAIVSWHASATHGTPVTLYRATSTPGGKICTTTTLTCKVTGLTNGTPYTFTIVALSSAGTSPASGATNTITPAIGQWTGPVSAVPAPAGYSHPIISGRLDDGTYLGTALSGSNSQDPFLWASLTDTNPTPLAVPGGNNQCDIGSVPHNGAGMFGDYCMDQGHNWTYQVWASPTAAPAPLALPTGCTTPGGSLALLANGEFLGGAYGGTCGSGELMAWPDVSGAPVLLTLPSGFSATSNASFKVLSSTGQIVAEVTDLTQGTNGREFGVIWQTPTSTPTVLNTPIAYAVSGILSVAANGEVLGDVITDGTSSITGRPGPRRRRPRRFWPCRPVHERTVKSLEPDGSIVGWGTDGSSNRQMLVWTSATATPYPMAVPAGVTSINLEPSIASDGSVTTTGLTSGQPVMLVWPTSTSAPYSIASPGGTSTG